MNTAITGSPFRGAGGRRILFIDRDGVLIKEAPPTYQIDSFEKLEFYPGVFTWLARIARELNYELVMVSNQDGLGTPSYPEEKYNAIEDFILKQLKNEGIIFSAIYIDRSFPNENKATRKPGIGMLTGYLNNDKYSIADSFVIGDRITDVQLAKNLGCKAIWFNNDPNLGIDQISDSVQNLQSSIALETTEWKKIYEFLKIGSRLIKHERNTNETKISIEINLDGTGKSQIETGLNFFNHMLDQMSRHSGIDLTITVIGDLQIDEHHTTEDTAIALGEAFSKALGVKQGIERYGFTLPMDDRLA